MSRQKARKGTPQHAADWLLFAKDGMGGWIGGGRSVESSRIESWLWFVYTTFLLLVVVNSLLLNSILLLIAGLCSSSSPSIPKLDSLLLIKRALFLLFTHGFPLSMGLDWGDRAKEEVVICLACGSGWLGKFVLPPA